MRETALSVEDVKVRIKYLFQESQTPIMLWGPPGIGKTESIKQAMAELARGENIPVVLLNYNMGGSKMAESFIASSPVKDKEGKTFLDTILRATIAEVYYPDGKVKEYHTSDVSITELLKDELKGKAYLYAFFDDFTSVYTDQQTVFLDLLTNPKSLGNRMLASYTEDNKIRIVMAANSEAHDDALNRLLGPIKSRIKSYVVKPDFKEFLNYAVKKEWHPALVSFLQREGEATIVLDPADLDEKGTKVSIPPRQLEILNRTLRSLDKLRERGFNISSTFHLDIYAALGTAEEKYTRIYPDLDPKAKAVADRIAEFYENHMHMEPIYQALAQGKVPSNIYRLEGPIPYAIITGIFRNALLNGDLLKKDNLRKVFFKLTGEYIDHKKGAYALYMDDKVKVVKDMKEFSEAERKMLQIGRNIVESVLQSAYSAVISDPPKKFELVNTVADLIDKFNEVRGSSDHYINRYFDAMHKVKSKFYER